MKHSLFWAAVEAGAKAGRDGFHATRSGLSVVGALVDCGIPRQHVWADALCEKEAEEDVAEPRLQGCGRCDGPLSVLRDGLCPSCWDYYYLDDDVDTYAECNYTPRPRTASKCGKCNQDMILQHYCESPENSRTNAGATCNRAVEETSEGASPPAAPSDVLADSWVAIAIPVIAEVLADHVPNWSQGGVECFRPNRDGRICGEFADWRDWRAHVSPHIADRLEAVTLAPPEGGAL